MQTQTRPALPNIDDVSPLNELDRKCMTDVRRVLTEHGKLSRFGLTLLHDHFVVDAEEILLEDCDVETRTLTIRPVKQSSLNSVGVVETNWRLDTMEGFAACQQVCITSSNGNGGSTHSGHHNSG